MVQLGLKGLKGKHQEIGVVMAQLQARLATKARSTSLRAANLYSSSQNEHLLLPFAGSTGARFGIQAARADPHMWNRMTFRADVMLLRIIFAMPVVPVCSGPRSRAQDTSCPPPSGVMLSRRQHGRNDSLVAFSRPFTALRGSPRRKPGRRRS